MDRSPFDQIEALGGSHDREVLGSGRQERLADLETAAGIDDVVRIAGWRFRRLDEPTGFDEISGTAYPTGIELIGEPVAPNLLGLTVVVLRHHRIGLRREDKRAGG